MIGVLTCGIDESGTHKGSDILAVAGCVASGRQWKLLAGEWLPQIAGLRDGYHAKRRDCEALNPVLADIMRRRMGHTHVVTIIEDEYKKYASQRFRSIVGSAYTLAVHGLVHRIGTWCEKENVNYVAYVLEGGHRNQPHVDALLTEMVKRPERRKQMRIWSHTWSSKEDPTLHPADLLSHEITTRLTALARTLWERAVQEHIGPEEIQELEHIILGGLDKWKRQVRRSRGQ